MLEPTHEMDGSYSSSEAASPGTGPIVLPSSSGVMATTPMGKTLPYLLMLCLQFCYGDGTNWSPQELYQLLWWGDGSMVQQSPAGLENRGAIAEATSLQPERIFRRLVASRRSGSPVMMLSSSEGTTIPPVDLIDLVNVVLPMLHGSEVTEWGRTVMGEAQSDSESDDQLPLA